MDDADRGCTAQRDTTFSHLQAAADQMAAELEAVSHAIQELTKRRGHLRDSLRQVRAVIKNFADQEVDTPLILARAEASIPSNVFDTSQAPSTRAAIIRWLNTVRKPQDIADIIEGIRTFGVESQPATIRSLLSKMSEAGEIEKPRRGIYQLPPSRPSGSPWARGTRRQGAGVYSPVAGLGRESGEPRDEDAAPDLLWDDESAEQARENEASVERKEPEAAESKAPGDADE